MQPSSPHRGSLFLGIVIISGAIAAAFHPVVDFDFIYLDVHEQVTGNPQIRTLTVENVLHILSSRCVTSYYPVRTLSFAVDHHFGGLHAGWFKRTNVLIHCLNTVLVLWLVLRLVRTPANEQGSAGLRWQAMTATFAAGIFALHPVVVEPVVWVAGREELLMTLGALGCIHVHITAWRLRREGAEPGWIWTCRVGEPLFCAIACLSNAVGAVIPLLIVTWDILFLNKPKARRVVVNTVPLWVIAATALLIKALGSLSNPFASSTISAADRIKLVPNVYWLNLRTLAWPRDLGFEYSNLQPESLFDPGVMLGAAAIATTVVTLWMLRRKRALLFGLVWFLITLGPSCQIIPHHIHRADRFLYMPLAGLATAIAVSLGPLESRLKLRSTASVIVATGAFIIVLLCLFSSAQVWTWQNDLTVWRNALKVNPDNAEVRCALADHLAAYGLFHEALQTYQEGTQRHPDDARIHGNYGWLLATCADHGLRDYDQAVRLARRACELTEWNVPAVRATLATVHCSLAQDLAERRDFTGAVRNYQKALEAEPENTRALSQLAVLGATSSDQEIGDPPAP